MRCERRKTPRTAAEPRFGGAPVRSGRLPKRPPGDRRSRTTGSRRTDNRHAESNSDSDTRLASSADLTRSSTVDRSDERRRDAVRATSPDARAYTLRRPRCRPARRAAAPAMAESIATARMRSAPRNPSCNTGRRRRRAPAEHPRARTRRVHRPDPSPSRHTDENPVDGVGEDCHASAGQAIGPHHDDETRRHQRVMSAQPGTSPRSAGIT